MGVYVLGVTIDIECDRIFLDDIYDIYRITSIISCVCINVQFHILNFSNISAS